jgi:hypothetical protein
MNDVLQWISQGVLAALLVYLAFRRAPSEINSNEGSAANDAMQALKTALELNAQYSKQLKTYAEREREYEINIKFKTTSPPQVGEVIIKPVPNKEKI